jgi:hypothetical protein
MRVDLGCSRADQANAVGNQPLGSDLSADNRVHLCGRRKTWKPGAVRAATAGGNWHCRRLQQLADQALRCQRAQVPPDVGEWIAPFFFCMTGLRQGGIFGQPSQPERYVVLQK